MTKKDTQEFQRLLSLLKRAEIYLKALPADNRLHGHWMLLQSLQYTRRDYQSKGII